MSRRLVLVAVAAVAVLAAVGGWLLGRQIESPAEAAARIAAPPASLISVPVEQRELSSAVITRGTIEFDQSEGIDVTGSEIGSSIITRLTKQAGDELIEGDVAIEVAGRPLIVLQGELPVFRTFSPGLEGPDVLQLEEALERLGYDPGPVDGTFGSRTESAIEELYRDAGYRPPAIDVADQSALDGARDRVSDAEDALAAAQRDVVAPGLPQSQRLELDQYVAQAQAAVDGLRSERDATVGELVRQLENRLAEEADLRNAWEIALDRHEEAVRTGIDPVTGEVATPAEIAELRTERLAAKAVHDDAVAAVAEANAARNAEASNWTAQIDDATVGVEIASAQRSEAIAQAGSGGGDEFVRQAQSELADANDDLVSLERDIGIRLSASELVFLPSLPRLVQRLNVGVGDFPEGSVMDVTGSEIAVVSGVSAADRALLEVGQIGTLDDPNEGITVQAEIDCIADSPGGPDLSTDRYRIRLVPIGDVPDEVFNESLRLRIPISSTGGEVLTVPLAALSAAADGSTRVEKLIDDQTTELVDVRVGLSAGGFVEVEALSGSLDVTDRVVVGRDQPDEVEQVDEEAVEQAPETESDEESSDGDATDAADGSNEG